MSRWLLLLALTLGLVGCQSSAITKPKLPYDAWYLGFLAPNYMEVWLEQVNIGDNSGQIFPNAMGGVVAMGQPESLSATAKGWPKRIGSGKGRYLTGLDLPYVVSLRWQSMVEPQTYHALFTIPDWARRKMVERLSANCPSGRAFDYRESLTIGLAPGGVVKVWIKGPCLDPIEVLTLQAEVEPKGPYGGKSNGKYRPLSPVVKAYVDKYGVPYGSWWAPIPYTMVGP
ncbi:hypothetical protein NS274_19670 [Pseudomonas oryzihabitans]|uniref:DUF2931 family protein n=1 Tax=Pseudomonas rhizoryzae TaxID=2571129 RepID=UPI000737160E|nr:DUF2931 family protein [Pseudomonas rhizoryzae]APQ12413.1 hypothetical protein BJP27_13235 [Pseudomonas psychrotolerans]KTS73850.1 hypothetical protein NS274_19670 [Pseudomonas psychrotolerans]KTT37267.1 hypothetical protein SB9_03050 [Pseudomonas psychrotolerans]KTT64481.1 hypothetical protein NS383_15235 [Pseudomonas psychrotolerans]KTT78804.1 hypothetical protein SB18R_00230 [Pseudomonas psychrotolerans]